MNAKMALCYVWDAAEAEGSHKSGCMATVLGRAAGGGWHSSLASARFTSPSSVLALDAPAARSAASVAAAWPTSTANRSTSVGSAPKFSSLRPNLGSVHTLISGDRPRSPPQARASLAMAPPTACASEVFQDEPCAVRTSARHW